MKTGLLKITILSIVVLLFVGFCTVQKAEAASWVSTGRWPKGLGYHIYALTTGTDGKIWAAGTYGYTAYWNGSSWQNTGGWYALDSCNIYALTTGTDGKIWVAGDCGYTAYWNGSRWEDAGRWPYEGDYCIKALTEGSGGLIWAVGNGIGCTAYWSWRWLSSPRWPVGDSINALTMGANGVMWAAGSNGYTAYRSGPEWAPWVSAGQWPHGSSYHIHALTTGTDGKIWAAGDGGYTAYWNGSSWVSAGQWPHDGMSIKALTTGTDGKIWAAGDGGYMAYWNGSSWVSVGRWPHGGGYSILALTTGTDGKIWAAGSHGHTAYYSMRNTEFSLVPNPNGATGQFIVSSQVSGIPGVLVNVQVSTDGSTFTNLGIPGAGTLAYTPTTDTTYFRLELKYQRIRGVFQTIYSNTVAIPTIGTPPNVSYATGVALWDQTRGRCYVTLSWPAVANATGYRLWIWDGHQSWSKDLGNVTSWNSRTAKVFPFPSELPENNSVSTCLFHFDGSGTDFEDITYRLYRSTIGTTYDNDPWFVFNISAYNSWMETRLYVSGQSNPMTAVVIPPTATDSSQPTGTVSAVSQEGFEKTYNPDINVTVNITDSGAGIWKIELSNDGTTYTTKYTATKNADNSTGVSSYANTFAWTVPLGAGTKVVYVRVTDAVGNVKVISDTVALAEDMLPPSITLSINNGAESTTSANATLTITVTDNASASSQMQMRFSNNATLWSPWETFNQTKSWDITNSSYGGTSSSGIKKVYVQITDQAQNVGLAYDEIGYNPSPPTGTVTISGGTSGTWNGQSALFSLSDSPTLSLSFSGASQIRFDLGVGVWGDWETYAASKTVNLVKSSGACTLKIQVKDSYGVASPIYSYLIVIDSQAPTISTFRGANRATATTGTSITMDLVAADNLPGNLQYRYEINGGSYTSWANLSGTSISVSGLSSGVNNITLEVKDLAGNTASTSAVIFKI